jgi:glutamate--cysteine ligase
MVKKFRVALALQPIATALFADSPFTEGKPNGYQSYRSHIWTDTDPGRTGMLDFVFEDGFSFERYTDGRKKRVATSFALRSTALYQEAANDAQYPNAWHSK